MDLITPPPRVDGSESENGDPHHLQATHGDSLSTRPHVIVESEEEKIMGKYMCNAEGRNEEGEGSGVEATVSVRGTTKAAPPDAAPEATTNGHACWPLKSGSASVPFAMVTGEVVWRVATTTASGKLFLTNFRLHHYSPLDPDALINVPLGLIELAELRDPLVLTLYCKNGSLFHIPFEDHANSVDTADDWLKQVSEATTATEK